MKVNMLGKILLVFCVMLLIVAGWKPVEVEGKIVIRISHHQSAKASPPQIFCLDFKEIVEKRSKGAIEVQIFPAGQLGQEKENINGVHMGTIEMCYAGSPLADQYYAGAAISYLPFLFNDSAHFKRSFGKNGKAAQILNEEMAKRSNIRLLSHIAVGYKKMMLRKKPLTGVEDLKGLKMRSPENEWYIKMYRSLGARPTPISFGEVYTALQTGVVDGLCSTLQGCYKNRIHEVAKYMAATDHVLILMGPMINKKFYSGLSPEFQKIVSEASQEATDKFHRMAEAADAKALEQMKKEGLQFNEKIDKAAFRKATVHIHEEFVQKTKARNLYDIVVAEGKK